MNRQTEEPRSVDDWFRELPLPARPICEKLRDLIRGACLTLVESLKWGSPSYRGRGLVCGVGAFKEHVTLHFFRGRELPDPDGLLAHGQGNASSRSVKFTSLQDLYTVKLRRLLKAAVVLDAQPVRVKAPRVRRAPLPMPSELAMALNESPRASAFFASLPPSCQREYIEWIIEARRPETKARRLESALAMLKAGRRRNEGYRR